jgi:hypothetical protein
MYAYPAKTEYNRVLPKIKIYAHAKPSKRVKALFVSQVGEIVWKYKLFRDTINLPPRDGYTEIQVFEISLKEPELAPEVLRAIDRAIPYPIFYRLRYGSQVKRVAAYKRPAADASNKWVLGSYFATDWADAAGSGAPLPVALDIKILYEQMLSAYIDLPFRSGESLEELVARVEAIRKCRREIQALEAKQHKEQQFNRKVDLNAQVRANQMRLQELQ